MAKPKSEIPWLDRHENGTWYVHWYDGTAQRTKRLSLRTRDADEAKGRYVSFLTGGSPQPSLDCGPTVSSALDRYLAEHVAERCAAPDRQRHAAANLSAFFQGTYLRDVDVPMSRAYARSRGEGLRAAKAATIRREMGVLVAAVNHAVKWGRLASDSAPSVEMPLVPRSHVSFFTVEQIRALVDSSDGYLRAFIVLAYFTAARRRAITGLLRGQVDVERCEAALHRDGDRQTQKRKATVPLNKACVHQVKVLMLLSEGERLFPETFDAYRQFKTLCRRLGFDGGHPHMLRHSRATHLLESGQDIYKVARILGDTVATVERTYGHSTPEYEASAVADSDAFVVGF